MTGRNESVATEDARRQPAGAAGHPIREHCHPVVQAGLRDDRGPDEPGTGGTGRNATGAAGGSGTDAAGRGDDGAGGVQAGGNRQRRMTPYADRKKLLDRLRRIEGQVRGLQRMVEEERYCVDVLVQVAAVRAALDAVALQLLEQHTHHCVQEAVRSGDGDAAIDEVMAVVQRLLRTP